MPKNIFEGSPVRRAAGVATGALAAITLYGCAPDIPPTEITHSELEAEVAERTDHIVDTVDNELQQNVLAYGEACVRSMNASILLEQDQNRYDADNAAVGMSIQCDAGDNYRALRHIYGAYKDNVGRTIRPALRAGMLDDDFVIDDEERGQLEAIVESRYLNSFRHGYVIVY